MKHLASGLLLLLMTPFAQAFTLDEWHTHQAQGPAFQSHIEQSRWLAEQETRVHTNGRLLFTPGQPMIWEWLSPLQAMLEVDNAGQFFDLTPGAEVTVDPDVADQDGLPGPKQVSRLLLAILNGDMATLKASYHLMLSGDAEHWRLALLPRQTGDDIPKLLTLTGGRFLETLKATTESGNALDLRLFDHSVLVDHTAARQFKDSLPSPAPASDATTSSSTSN